MHATVRWTWGLLAAIFLALVALYPQINLWLERGQEWQGAYATCQTDEWAYSAYLNGLITGQPRKSDIYTLGASAATQPQSSRPETIFSIQFIPSYLVALPARLLGVDAGKAFVAISPIVAFFTVLVIFYLLVSLTGDDALSATGALCVLCLGTLVAGRGVIQQLLGQDVLGSALLFLRRYEPCVPFPFLFLLFAFTWHTLTSEGRRMRVTSVLMGLTFVVLVFSYFFLWTSAMVWLMLIAFLWLIANPQQWRSLINRFLPTILLAIAGLIPYAILLSKRAKITDNAQVFDLSHRPDLLRVPELLGLVLFILIVWQVRKGTFSWRQPAVLFAISFTILPVLLFNQQVITGRSLQPFHYEEFVTNYCVMLVVFIIAPLIWHAYSAQTQIPRRTLALITIMVGFLGVLEVRENTRFFESINYLCDQVVPVAKRIKELTKNKPEPQMVFSTNIFIVADTLPTYLDQPVLWAIHMPNALGVRTKECRERLFMQLYYSGVSVSGLIQALANNETFMVVPLFGYERSNHLLSANYRPLTVEEIRAEGQKYSDYIATFNQQRADTLRFSYVIVPLEDNTNFINLDRWYQRDAGEIIGPLILYKVTPRAAN